MIAEDSCVTSTGKYRVRETEGRLFLHLADDEAYAAYHRRSSYARRASVIARSGHAVTQSPHDRQASALGV